MNCLRVETRKLQSELGFCQARDGCENFLHIGNLVQRVDLGKSNDALLIDDKGGAFGNAGHGGTLSQNPEFLSDFPVRKEIGTERNFEHAYFFFLPGDVADEGICTDAQDLGIQGRKLGSHRVEFGQLGSSSRGPIEGMKSNDQNLSSKVLPGAYPDFLFPDDSGEVKVGGTLSDTKWHTLLS